MDLIYLVLIESVTVCSSCDENEAVAAVLERVSQRLRRIESSLEGHRSVLVVGGGGNEVLLCVVVWQQLPTIAPAGNYRVEFRTR